MEVHVRSSWLNTAQSFACHDRSCAPPPAGSGGSSPSPRVSLPHIGTVYRDHTHGIVIITHAKRVEGKPYDRVTIKKHDDGTSYDIFMGSKGIASRETTYKPRNTDDGYDAIRDNRNTGPAITWRPAHGRKTYSKYR